jgi:quinol monooxygenase YgiN
MLAPTRAATGCRLYELYEPNSGGRFYFYEIWKSQAALGQHAASPPFKHLEKTVGELVTELFETNIFTSLQIGKDTL